MKKIKKIIVLGMVTAVIAGVLAACGGEKDAEINVVSREDGSGTRGAFIELFGIEIKDEKGEKVDNTLSTAEITNSTSVMVQTIAGNENGIGYVSLGSLDDSVKALKIDGVAPTGENVKNGSYKISRPFNIVTKEDVDEEAEDFITFIMSEEGQKIVEEAGYISRDNTGKFSGGNASGKLVIAGSSSVTPVMEKLVEAYGKFNPDLKIEVQQSDSTTGVTSTAEGVCDIGMVSRALKPEELSRGIIPQVIALDGIAVIVNHENKIEDMSGKNVMDIYTGVIAKWSEIK